MDWNNPRVGYTWDAVTSVNLNTSMVRYLFIYLFIFNSRHKAHDTKIINRLQYNTDSNIHTIPTRLLL